MNQKRYHTSQLMRMVEQLAKIVFETRNWICPPVDTIDNLQKEIKKMENDLKQSNAGDITQDIKKEGQNAK